MSWFCKRFPRLCDGRIRRGLIALRRVLMHLVMGRRFMRTLELNKAAADHLDAALKELVSR